VHYEYDATIHAAVPTGVPLRVKGTVTERYEKKGRQYVVMQIDLATREGTPLITYRDTVILAYKQGAQS
jgi:hypothetical protein